MASQNGSPGKGLRVAFAGASHWHFLVDACYLDLAREAEVEIVGLSDDDEAVARERGERVGCPWTTDVVDLVERFKPDLVVALPRPDRGPAQVAALLECGVPLFSEKPIGLRADLVWPLVERAERGWATVAFPNRYLPIWERLDALRSSGQLGPLGHLHLRLVKSTPARYLSFGVPWMLDPTLSGGGPLRNFGIHFADLISWQLGPRAARVVGASLTRRLHHHPIEDFGAAVLQTEAGVVVTLEAGYSLATGAINDQEFRVAARDAFLIQRGGRLEVHRGEGEPEVVQAEPGHNSYRDLFFDTLRRLRRGDPPVATIRDCALANETCDAMYAAAEPRSVER